VPTCIVGVGSWLCIGYRLAGWRLALDYSGRGNDGDARPYLYN